MSSTSRFTSRRLAAVFVASALVLGVGACSDDGGDKSADTSTAVTEAPTDTSGGSDTTAAPSGGEDTQAYCAAVQENQSNSDRVAAAKAVQEVAPAELQEDIATVIELVQNPDDADLKTRGADALAAIGKYNSDVCGIAMTFDS